MRLPGAAGFLAPCGRHRQEDPLNPKTSVGRVYAPTGFEGEKEEQEEERNA
jgi:hypothetical protein